MHRYNIYRLYLKNQCGLRDEGEHDRTGYVGGLSGVDRMEPWSGSSKNARIDSYDEQMRCNIVRCKY